MKCYIKLFWNVPAIGKCGAAFIKKLLELRGKEIKCAQLDVVAFSIGAHIAAQISNNLPFKCLPRITGKLKRLKHFLSLSFFSYFIKFLNIIISLLNAMFSQEKTMKWNEIE